MRDLTQNHLRQGSGFPSFSLNCTQTEKHQLTNKLLKFSIVVTDEKLTLSGGSEVCLTLIFKLPPLCILRLIKSAPFCVSAVKSCKSLTEPIRTHILGSTQHHSKLIIHSSAKDQLLLLNSKYSFCTSITEQMS